MSLRGYLFSLIGGLIALLTIIQLAMVYWIENTISKEVDMQARHYSEQIIELAVEQFDGTTSPNVVIKKPLSAHAQIKIEHNKKTVNDESSVKIFTYEDEQIVELIPPQKETNSAQRSPNTPEIKISKKLLKEEFKTIIDKLHTKQLDAITKTNGMQTYVVNTPNLHQQTWVSAKPISDQTQLLFTKIQWMLVVVAALGLVFAFWLSSQFNKPLKQLAKGFERLAGGNYQHNVPVKGVKEIRKTISHFNKMVKRLDELSKTEQQNKELSHLAELGEVSRGLAHALRNPIHTIGLSIEQLSDDALTADQREQLLETVQDKIQHLDKNIKALLTLTANGITRHETVPLLAVVQDIMLEYKSTVSKTVNFELAIANDLNIKGAESEIRSILHTLINNACEASPENGLVKIVATNENHQTIITVIDQGTGLEQHIESQLFQPHVSSKPDGAGMGLYIAKRLITLHYDGQLTVTNNQNEGCSACAKFGSEK